jgi:hypothetical protein
MISETLDQHFKWHVIIFVACLTSIFRIASSEVQATRLTPTNRVQQTKRTHSSSKIVKLYPVDEAVKDRSLMDFKWRLRRAIRKRDGRFLLTIVDPQIRLGFGGERGLDTFKQEWQPSKRTSEFWKQLSLILSLGGTYESETGDEKYCAPYVTTRWKTLVRRFPEFGNASEYAVVVRDVNGRARPSIGAPVVARLSFDVVRVNWDSVAKAARRGSEWVRIRTLRGRVAYVQASDVRSPIDYSACFKKINGRWMMVSFIAGD